MYATVHADPEWQTHTRLEMCRLSYNDSWKMCVNFFYNHNTSDIDQDHILCTGSVRTVLTCIRQITMTLSYVCFTCFIFGFGLFLKKRENVASKFFKMIPIVQIMFKKEAILI